MRRPLPRHRLALPLGLVLSLLPLLASPGLGRGAARAQGAHPAAPPPPWERWFAALNAGDVAGVVALMRAEVDEGGVLVSRCAGGCPGMDAIEAGVAELVTDGYRGLIDPASVLVVDGLVSFDVLEATGAPPAQAVAITRWAMALEGELITPACAGVCLRSPTARAALLAARPPPAAAPPALLAAAAPRAGATPPTRAPGGDAPPAAPAGGLAGPTPAPWVLGGFGAALLLMAASLVASAAHAVWRTLRHKAQR